MTGLWTELGDGEFVRRAAAEGEVRRVTFGSI